MEGTQKFNNLELAPTKPTSVQMEVVEVVITAENLFGDFAKAFVAECYRINPLTAEHVHLTQEEMTEYIKFLVYKRLECVAESCHDWRRLKTLRIPSWIQYNLSMIGKVILRAVGLTLTPVMDPEDVKSLISLDQAFEISNKISAFEDDLQIVEDAMPRSVYGDEDVMSTAMIAGYVRSLRPVQHVASTYVTAFMGMKLREEAAMKVLYRVQYDDVAFIRNALINDRGILR